MGFWAETSPIFQSMGEKGGVPATKAISFFRFYSLEFLWVMEKEGVAIFIITQFLSKSMRREGRNKPSFDNFHLHTIHFVHARLVGAVWVVFVL